MFKNLPRKWLYTPLIIALMLVTVVFWEISTKPSENPTSCPPMKQFSGQGSKNSSNPMAEHPSDSPKNSPNPQDFAEEDEFATILGDQNLSPIDAVRRLIADLPRFDAATQEEAAQHIANLSDDMTAMIWVQKLISNQLPLPAAEILFNNLLSRSEDLVLPTLAAIADQPNHPQNSESAQILKPLLGSPKPGSSWRNCLEEQSQHKY